MSNWQDNLQHGMSISDTAKGGALEIKAKKGQNFKLLNYKV